MRTISLRRFRDSIPEVGETVQVTRRDADGNYQILGTWTPSVLSIGSEPLEPTKRQIAAATVERANAAIEHAVAERFAPVPREVAVSFRPVPKPSQRRK